jgi:WD40 repeat protein
MSTIRHLAASRDGSVVAAAEFKSLVHLWDLNSLSWLRTFNTTLDFGGRRLAVSPDGSLVAAGAYRRHGIAVYRASDGSELWRRKDLKKVQRLEFSNDGRRLFCCFDDKACESLDSSNGASGVTLRGARNIWVSKIGSARLIECAKNYIIEDDTRRFAIPMMSFAALSAAFSRSQVCLSEAGGSVRVYSLSSATMLWQYDPPKGTHFLRVTCMENIDEFAGVSWAFNGGGGYMLHRFNRDTGESARVADAPDAYECVFFRNGTRLLTASGAVINVTSGDLEATIDFPHEPPSGQNP